MIHRALVKAGHHRAAIHGIQSSRDAKEIAKNFQTALCVCLRWLYELGRRKPLCVR